MPVFLLPFALGGLALAAVGLGVKRVLAEAHAAPSFPEGSRAAQAMARHQEALVALRASRERVKQRTRAYGELQARARRETVEPFRALLTRLERWEQARAAELLTAPGHQALSALPEDPTPRALRQGWALLGAGAVPPPSLEAMLRWLEAGWLTEDAPPVVVDGVALYPAAACQPPSPDEAEVARAFDTASAQLHQAVAFLDAVHARLEALEARVATLQGRAAAQLAYLDPTSFEEDSPEPRERLRRLGHLMAPLAESLRWPVLTMQGGLAPLPEPLEA